MTAGTAKLQDSTQPENKENIIARLHVESNDGATREHGAAGNVAYDYMCYIFCTACPNIQISRHVPALTQLQPYRHQTHAAPHGARVQLSKGSV